MLVRLPEGGHISPHAGKDGWCLMAVVKGVLSYADGDALEQNALVDYPAGSILAVPANTLHYAKARHGEVFLQVVSTDVRNFSAELSQQLAITTDKQSTGKIESKKETGALVQFLTTDENIIAAHAFHFAETALRSGRQTITILVGNAGRLAIKELEPSKSKVSGDSLRNDLERIIENGGGVFITPYTLSFLKFTTEDLIDNVSLPTDPETVHKLMYAPSTKLIVW